jgi:predicted HTH domain antitoxin
MKLTIELPAELVRSPESAARDVLEGALLHAYTDGRISVRALGRWLGLSCWQAEEYLARRGVLLNYTAADLAADRTAFPARA